MVASKSVPIELCLMLCSGTTSGIVVELGNVVSFVAVIVVVTVVVVVVVVVPVIVVNPTGSSSISFFRKLAAILLSLDGQ